MSRSHFAVVFPAAEKQARDLFDNLEARLHLGLFRLKDGLWGVTVEGPDLGAAVEVQREELQAIAARLSLIRGVALLEWYHSISGFRHQLYYDGRLVRDGDVRRDAQGRPQAFDLYGLPRQSPNDDVNDVLLFQVVERVRERPGRRRS